MSIEVPSRRHLSVDTSEQCLKYRNTDTNRYTNPDTNIGKKKIQFQIQKKEVLGCRADGIYQSTHLNNGNLATNVSKKRHIRWNWMAKKRHKYRYTCTYK